ncbi:MAG: ATP-dependent DNA helicase UvrD2 [Acidimicrobiales bacterium]
MDHRHELLEGLTDIQRHAVQVEAAPLCILAGAGSGKTRVLTRRIAWRLAGGSAQPAHVLALTFTRKASGELRQRLAALGVREQVAAGTFHAVAYAQLRRRWADLGQTAPTLLQRKVGLLGRLLDPPRRGAGAGAGPDRDRRAVRTLGEVAGEIEWAKARLVTPGDYPEAAAGAGRRTSLVPSELASLYTAYEAEKRRRGLVDFDDLLIELGRAIDTDPELAAAQRWRFRHLFVDEFQDVNPAQVRLLQAWLGTRLDLCVVGDPCQAIYAWNGADPTVLTQLSRRYPSTTVVELRDNWRSSAQILAAAGAVLAGMGGPAQGAGRAIPGAGIVTHRPDGPVPGIRAYQSDRDEAQGVARTLRRAHGPGRAWSHLAVLARTNAQLVLLEQSLRAAGIPSRVTGAKPFLEQPEVEVALCDIERGTTTRPFSRAVADLQEAAYHARTAGRTRAPADPAAAGEETDHLEVLLRLAGEYLALDPSASVGGFRSFLDASLGNDRSGGGERGDAVELLTFHRAKGLEWPVVCVVGLEQGLVPIGHASSPAAEAEERRLLYVAMTRAEQELHCSWAERRTFGDRVLRRGPSPFLALVETAIAALGKGTRRSEVPERVAGARRQLGAGAGAGDRGGQPTPLPARPSSASSADADPEVLDALRRWRAATAKASGVPAHVILHDATLATVATARPATTEELVALPGLGPVKASRYGPALLDTLSRFAATA